ncbi:LOW QUALITY PROTEIN: P2Y purinoceptor 11 [Rhynchonycteris naso]
MGDQPCPANILEAAEQVFSSFQEGFLWPMLVTKFLVAVVTKSLALYCFSTQEHPWHPAVVLAQLAVSDPLYALMPPLAAYLYPPKHWRCGEAMCHLEHFLFTCSLLGSLVLTWVSGVIHPFVTHLGHQCCWLPPRCFSHFTPPQQEGNSTLARSEACIKCLGTAGELKDYTPCSLVLVARGCGLPLLLTLAAYTALWQAVHVAVLVASGMALDASFCVPNYVTQATNMFTWQRRRAHCPAFVGTAQAVEALDLGSYVSHHVTQVLMPLAICIHPLLYMTSTQYIGCRLQRMLRGSLKPRPSVPQPPKPWEPSFLS